MVPRFIQYVVLASCFAVNAAFGADWITAPSYFTHDQTGQRVRQYAPIGPFYVMQDPTYQRSGYRHTRSSLQVSGNIDHYHVVEEWGRGVRPYDEWRYPYRPYSVPYADWGPPYAGAGAGFGYGFGGGYPPGIPWAQPFNGYGYGGRDLVTPYRGYQPWNDDRYPAFDDRAPFRNPGFPRQPDLFPQR